jgi:hypothetical protein
MTNAAKIIAKAQSMADAVTVFYCSSVGRPINSNEEFSILVEWSDSIEAATAAALSVRSWMDVSDMDKMADECAMWLDHWKEAA